VNFLNNFFLKASSIKNTPGFVLLSLEQL